jgi:hypothetical protein
MNRPGVKEIDEMDKLLKDCNFLVDEKTYLLKGTQE